MNNINNNNNNFKNILCIRQDNLGDVLIASPAFRALKETFPQAKITLLASEMGASIAKHIPEIDQVLIFTPPWVKSDQVDNTALLDILPKVTKQQFDLAVIFTNFSQNPLPSAILPYLAKIPRRLSYCRENPYQLLTDWYLDSEPFSGIVHGVIRQLKLVEAIGAKTENKALSLQVAKESIFKVLKKLNDTGINLNKPWLVVHPGANEQKRRYPADLYAQVINLITDKLKFQVIITGIEKEENLVDIILKQTKSNVYSLVGKIDLDELIGLISLSPLLLSNNTGPSHIAAATNTPVVVLYARTNPEHTPWMVKSEVLFFDHSENLKSKNEILRYTYPDERLPLPKPETVFQSCSNLLMEVV